MNEKPHVVMLNKAYPPWIGGIERHVRDIGESLVTRGWRVTALVCNDQPLEVRESIGGVQVIRIPQWLRILSQPIVRGYFQCLRELEPDLIHVHVPFPLGWWTYHAVADRVPIICTWHSDIVRQRWMMPFLVPFQKRFLRRCNRIIPTSQPMLDYSSDLRAFHDHCTIIPLAVPPMPPENESRISQRALELNQQYPNPIVLFLGRLVGYKGLPYLTEAMQSLNASLLIAGEGPLKQRLQTLACRLGIDSRIHFLDSVAEEEKYALYRAADVMVLPSISRNEAFGYVLLEAMQQGCPVISTDLPTGMRIVNQDGVSGFVVPPGDSRALAESIQKIVGDRALRERLSEGARERAAHLFRFDSMMDRIEAVYWELLGETGSKSGVPVF